MDYSRRKRDSIREYLPTPFHRHFISIMCHVFWTNNQSLYVLGFVITARSKHMILARASSATVESNLQAEMTALGATLMLFKQKT